MITITGKINFDVVPLTEKHKEQSKWKKQASIDIGGELDLFYSKFIEKNYLIHLIRPHRFAHMTLVADRFNDSLLWEQVKKKYHGKKIKLQYDPDVRGNHEYWWLRATCKVGDEIRKELGLGELFFPYHITIGTVKDKEKNDNNYVLRCREYFG